MVCGWSVQNPQPERAECVLCKETSNDEAIASFFSLVPCTAILPKAVLDSAYRKNYTIHSRNRDPYYQLLHKYYEYHYRYRRPS